MAKALPANPQIDSPLEGLMSCSSIGAVLVVIEDIRQKRKTYKSKRRQVTKWHKGGVAEPGTATVGRMGWR